MEGRKRLKCGRKKHQKEMNWTCDKEVLKEDGVSRTAATTKETEWERQCQKETDCEQDKEISERNSVNRTKKKRN